MVTAPPKTAVLVFRPKIKILGGMSMADGSPAQVRVFMAEDSPGLELCKTDLFAALAVSGRRKLKLKISKSPFRGAKGPLRLMRLRYDGVELVSTKQFFPLYPTSRDALEAWLRRQFGSPRGVFWVGVLK